MTLQDAAARDRIRSDFDTTFIVEAAAGTGKTSELVRRIIGILREGGTTLDRMVIVTFTEKAAGELKLRIRSELERAREREDAGSDEASRLEEAMRALEFAHISTIHGFCTELLRERPVEAEVDPSFEVIAERVGAELQEQAFQSWYERVLDAPPEPLRRLLRKRRWGRDYGPRDMLLGALRRLVETRDFSAKWHRPVFHREARIDTMMESVARLVRYADKASTPDNTLGQNLQAMARWHRMVARRESVCGRDYDLLEHDFAELKDADSCWKHKGRGNWYGDGIRRAEVLAIRDELKERL